MMKEANENDKIIFSQGKTSKKDMIEFLYKTKNAAKKNKISCNMRVENYTNQNTTIYTYGFR